MAKPTTSYTRPSKPSTNSVPESPNTTNTAPVSKASTDTQANEAYEAVRTNYDTHVLYNAHIYYNGRDPDLIPGSTKNRTDSAAVSKTTTNYTAT